MKIKLLVVGTFIFLCAFSTSCAFAAEEKGAGSPQGTASKDGTLPNKDIIKLSKARRGEFQ